MADCRLHSFAEATGHYAITRPLENGLRPGAAASVRPDVAAMTRAQREALERRVLHGAQIEL